MDYTIIIYMMLTYYTLCFPYCATPNATQSQGPSSPEEIVKKYKMNPGCTLVLDWLGKPPSYSLLKFKFIT